MACLWFYALANTTETKIFEIISPWCYGEFTIDVQSVEHQYYGRIVKVFINYSIITDKFKHKLFENLIENMKILEKKYKMGVVLPPKHIFWITHDNCFHSGCTGDILGVGGKWKLYQKHHIIDKCFERINFETTREPRVTQHSRLPVYHRGSRPIYKS